MIEMEWAIKYQQNVAALDAIWIMVHMDFVRLK